MNRIRGRPIVHGQLLSAPSLCEKYSHGFSLPGFKEFSCRLDGGYHLPDSRGYLSGEHEKLADARAAYSRQSDMTPFSANTFWKEREKSHDKEAVKELLNYLYNRKKLMRLVHLLSH